MENNTVCNLKFMNEFVNALINGENFSASLKKEIRKKYSPQRPGDYIDLDETPNYIFPSMVEEWSQDKTTPQIAEVVGYIQNKYREEEYRAHQNHRDPYDLGICEAFSILFSILENRLEEEAFEKADNNLLLVPILDNDRYSDSNSAGKHLYFTCYELYVKDADTGKYILSTLQDDTYWGNEDSRLEDQLSINDEFIDTTEGIYAKDDQGNYHLFFKADDDFSYNVISSTLCWKRQRKTNKRTLLAKNFQTQKFEEIRLPVERLQGDHFLTTVFKNGEGKWRRGFYVRDVQTGKFVFDGDIPFSDYDDDCWSAEYTDAYFTGVYSPDPQPGERRKKYTYSGRVGEKGRIEVSE